MNFKQDLLFAGMVVLCSNVAASEPHDSGDDGAGKSEDHIAEQSHAIHWGYSGAEGPAQWGKLSDSYALCSSGKRQSPVNISDVEEQVLYPLSFHYNPVPVQVVNNGHTLQANYSEINKNNSVAIGGKEHQLASKLTYGSEMMLGDVSYKLLQFHFHTPSEHAHDSERHAMEVHLVHQAADGNLAVVGVFLKRGAKNAALQKVLDNASSTVNEVAVAAETMINAIAWLPDDRNYYHYSGSLTTPPCSENVNWFVMKEPIEVSDQQVSRFTQLIGENARPLQKVYWRTLFGSL